MRKLSYKKSGFEFISNEVIDPMKVEAVKPYKKGIAFTITHNERVLAHWENYTDVDPEILSPTTWGRLFIASDGKSSYLLADDEIEPTTPFLSPDGWFYISNHPDLKTT